jgi:uncharacterized damage-inducible protein DinB
MDVQKELIAEFENEVGKTRKMLSAIPEDADLGYKPHAKSMSLGRLAAHMAETPGNWAVQLLTQDEMVWKMEDFKPWVPASKTEVLDRFEKELVETKKILAAMTPEKWESHWKMGDGTAWWIDDTKYRVYREWTINHMIHHRAQLGVYLRLLDKPVPGTYGPSADSM